MHTPAADETRRPSAVVFDIGGVLIDVDLDLCPRRWADATGLEPDRLREVFWADRDYQPLERGEISLEDYRRSMVARLGAEIDPASFYAGWTGVYRGEIPGIAELQTRLAAQTRLACLSNTNAAHVETFTAQFPRLFKPFERCFYSNELGRRKPDPACYAPVLGYFAPLAPADIVFVDDKPANIETATSLGMRALHFTGTEALAADLRALGLNV